MTPLRAWKSDFKGDPVTSFLLFYYFFIDAKIGSRAEAFESIYLAFLIHFSNRFWTLTRNRDEYRDAFRGGEVFGIASPATESTW